MRQLGSSSLQKATSLLIIGPVVVLPVAFTSLARIAQ
jgi:hypothetical protein